MPRYSRAEPKPDQPSLEVTETPSGKAEGAPSQPNGRKRRGFPARDLERAIRVALRTGLAVTSVEITPDGRITVRFGESTDPMEAELDEELRLWRLEKDRCTLETPSKKRR